MGFKRVINDCVGKVPERSRWLIVNNFCSFKDAEKEQIASVLILSSFLHISLTNNRLPSGEIINMK